MALPENLDGGHRAIVIEDVPPDTGIAGLVRAFSPFGTIQFASMGPPAVVGFESEEAAAHALLVASMKSVSLLGVYSEKAAPEGATSTTAETAAAGATSTTAETAAAMAETKTSQNKAASASAVHIDQEELSSLMDSILALEKNLDTLNSLLTEQVSKNEEEEKDNDIDVYDYDSAWTEGYNSALYWPDDNYYDAWFAGYKAGVKDSPVGFNL